MAEAFAVICDGLQAIVSELRQVRLQLEDEATELAFDQERRALLYSYQPQGFTHMRDKFPKPKPKPAPAA